MPNKKKKRNQNSTRNPEVQTNKENRAGSSTDQVETGKKKGCAPTKNDWKFYAASEQLAKDVASLPYNYVSGGKFRVAGETSTNTITNNEAIPGVMVLPYVSSIGVASGRADGVNNAAIQFYSAVRKANSGAKNYEAPDLMMYVLALRDIYATMAAAKQVIGLASRYDNLNINTPELILRSLGVDAADLRANLANYRYQFNLLVKKVNTFAMPEIFSVFARSVYIHSAVFMDSTSTRAQYYVFRKMGYHVWDGKTSERGTQLTYHTPTFIPTTDVSAKTFKALFIDPLYEMLNALYYDTDAQTMNGDIQKAFSTGLLQFVEVDENYATPFSMDEDILAQIENSHSVGYPIEKWVPNSDVSLDITQANQIISFNPAFNVDNYSTNNRPLQMTRLAFNSHKDNPDYKDNLEWSRLISTPVYGAPNAQGVTLINFASSGLEILTGYEVWYFDQNMQATFNPVGSVIVDATSQDIINIALVSNFDWHPTIYYSNRTSVLKPIADFKLATVVDVEIFNAINNAAIFGAFYSDQIGK